MKERYSINALSIVTIGYFQNNSSCHHTNNILLNIGDILFLHILKKFCDS